MLQSHREFRSAAYGVTIGEHGLLHSQFRIRIKDRDGMAKDDALLRPLVHRDLDGQTLGVQLIGDARFYLGGQVFDLRPGDFFLCPFGDLQGYAHEGRQRLVIVEWRSGSLSTKEFPVRIGPMRLEKRALERIGRLVDSFTHRRIADELLPHHAARLLAVLREEGLPFDPVEPGELREVAPSPTRRLSSAIDSCMSALSNRPALVDLEQSLGWSRQHISYLSERFREQYWLHTGANWRRRSQTWRLVVGAGLMSRPEARLEDVAKLLGYASPGAFRNAFVNAGLPSPGSLREVLRQRGFSIPER